MELCKLSYSGLARRRSASSRSWHGIEKPTTIVRSCRASMFAGYVCFTPYVLA